MPAKVCPRCGAQYQNLHSKTCPQCFAVLVSVDDATAEELAAARALVEQSPEFQQVKAEDDERYKEQSFGACLGVIVITAATLILAIVLITSAAHRHHTPAPNVGVARVEIGTVHEPLTTLPVAAAGLNDVMPAQIPGAFGGLTRSESDQSLVLPGTLTHIDHAAYTVNALNPVNAYAIPAGLPTVEQNQFRLAVTLAAEMGKRQSVPVFFTTQYWFYAAVGPNSTEFERALGTYFRTKENGH